MTAISPSSRPCPICISDDWEIVLPLMATPLGDRLSATKDKALSLPKYPLDLALCSKCGHTFLPMVVPPEESYNDYFFETSDSPGLSMSMKRLTEQLWLKSEKNKVSYVLDIGSNDGTWLQHFKTIGASVLGIEPSVRHAEESTARGIPTINDYFTTESAKKIKRDRGSPDLITANFVTANVPDLQDFFRGLSELSRDQTTIAILTGYHPEQFRVNMFDFIYHEHTSYFSCQDLVNLGSKFDLTLTDVRRVGLKGGSLQAIFRTKNSNTPINEDVNRLIQYENWTGVKKKSFFIELSERLKIAKQQTHEILKQVSAKKIAGYGVSHSVTTLIHHFELTEKISALTDDNIRRQGRFAPGSGLSVISPDEVIKQNFDTVIVMAWQHDRLIKKRLNEIGFSGSVIQPLPSAVASTGA